MAYTIADIAADIRNFGVSRRQSQPSYDSLAAVRADYEAQLAQIQNNDLIPDKAKARMTAELKTKMREAWFETKQALEAKEQGELKAAWKEANPAPSVANLSAGEIAARQEVLQDLEALKDNGDAILDLYARFYNQGYQLGMDAIADRGRRYLSAEQAKELQQLEDHRNPGMAQARANYEDLKARQGSDAQGRALQETAFLNVTQLDASESDALAKAQQGSQDGAA